MVRAGKGRSKRGKKGQLLVITLAALAISLACSITTPLLPTATSSLLTATSSLPTSASLTTPNPAAATAVLSTPASNLPTVTAVSSPQPQTAPVGLIAFVGADGNIYTIDRDGKQKSALTQDANLAPASGQAVRLYQYPTWAFDGSRLAFMSFARSDQGTQAKLVIASKDGKENVDAFTSQDTLPFYLFWSPNSQNVTFLSNDTSGTGLALYMSAAAGGDNKIIGTGNPYYWDWSPDNRALIVHTGGAASDNFDARLALVDLGAGVKVNNLDLKPGNFQAPAWSPVSDDLALVTQNDAGDESLVLAGRDGKISHVLAQLSGPASFAWSPKGGQLAYSTQVQSDSGPVNRLVVLDSAQPDHNQRIAQGVVAAYFWSPDGKKIAYFTVGSANPGSTALIAQTAPQISMSLNIYDLASGGSNQVAAFQPTDAFVQIFPFYDQYQRSGTIWSPDSRNLVVAGIDSEGNGGIYVANTDGSPLHKIADGDLAFWSWK